jgi:Xaa-Pro aminopeptidase
MDLNQNQNLFNLDVAQALAVHSNSMPGLHIDTFQYVDRISRFANSLAPQSIAVIVSNPEQTRSNDTEFLYRQASDLYYLNGFPEPDSVIVISTLGNTDKTVLNEVIMFVRPKDHQAEIWGGPRAGIKGAKANYLANRAFDIAQFETKITELLMQANQVYYAFGINPKLDETFRKAWQTNQKPLRNPNEVLHEMRLFKSKKELAVIRHAAKISALAHVQAMRNCKPGMYEHQLQAILEFVFRYYGATGPAYGSIVATGNNAITLHWTNNDSVIKDGDLILVDAACELGGLNGGYAADITRCFPANGKFSQAQAQIYQLVLDAELAAIAACKPNTSLDHVHQVAKRVLNRGLKKLGIAPGNSKAPLDLSDLFMHGTSHWMGIDVHDVGSYQPITPTHNYASSNNRRKKKTRLLEPGMVFTVEPGLYLDAHDKRVPKRYRGIGIRIEDDVLITENGCEVLTGAVPKTISEIEALMAAA